MLTFLKKSILIVLLILVIISPIALANKRATDHQLDSNSLILASNVDTLIVGDSHAEHSLDPSMLPGSVNISMGGESVFYT